MRTWTEPIGHVKILSLAVVLLCVLGSPCLWRHDVVSYHALYVRYNLLRQCYSTVPLISCTNSLLQLTFSLVKQLFTLVSWFYLICLRVPLFEFVLSFHVVFFFACFFPPYVHGAISALFIPSVPESTPPMAGRSLSSVGTRRRTAFAFYSVCDCAPLLNLRFVRVLMKASRPQDNVQ